MNRLRINRTSRESAAAYRQNSARLGACLPCSILLIVIWLIGGLQSCPASVCVSLSQSRRLRSLAISSFMRDSLPVKAPAKKAAEARFAAGAVICAGEFYPGTDSRLAAIFRGESQVDFRAVREAGGNSFLPQLDYLSIKSFGLFELKQFSVRGFAAAVEIKAVGPADHRAFISRGDKTAVNRFEFRPIVGGYLFDDLICREKFAECFEPRVIRRDRFAFPFGGGKAVESVKSDAAQVALIRHDRGLDRVIIKAVPIKFALEDQAVFIRQAMNRREQLFQPVIREQAVRAGLRGLMREDQAADAIKFRAHQGGEINQSSLGLFVRGEHRLPPAWRFDSEEDIDLIHACNIASELYIANPFCKKSQKNRGFFHGESD